MADRRAFASTLLGLVAVTLWLGAALFFATAVAPAAFGVLPQRSLAGDVIRRILPVLFVTGGLLGLGVAVLSVARARVRHWPARTIAALLMLVSCAIAQLGVAPRLASLRETMNAPVDTAVATAGADFGRLHMVSVAWLGVAILAAVSFVLFA